jgi:hypothetical protein
MIRMQVSKTDPQASNKNFFKIRINSVADLDPSQIYEKLFEPLKIILKNLIE